MTSMADVRAIVSEIAAGAGGVFGVAARSLHAGDEVLINEDEPFNAASIIKVAIMVEVFKQAEEGLLDLDMTVRLSDTDKVGGSGILQLLSSGVELPIIDLVRLMIVVSDNTASNLLLDVVGMDRVNDTMRGLGLSGIVLRRRFMTVPVAKPVPNSVTARDVTSLLEMIARCEVVSAWACCEMVRIMKQQQYNDLIPALLPVPGEEDELLAGEMPRVEVAHKTGSVSGVRHDAGIVYVPGRDYVVTILTKGLPRPRDGEEAIRRISLELFRHFTGD
ncbi:MAG: class A beta-lactamase-related serine hydrolase [Firmicutes bacterium]|jgi:beta-lactamase class A|nr:class A beta-lactamase-related serine hydrolase [Bacillota bacterium]MDH7494577.1 class A beta-lactamase-related serine hydrolase [Bacillota bacterium]